MACEVQPLPTHSNIRCCCWLLTWPAAKEKKNPPIIPHDNAWGDGSPWPICGPRPSLMDADWTGLLRSVGHDCHRLLLRSPSDSTHKTANWTVSWLAREADMGLASTAFLAEQRNAGNGKRSERVPESSGTSLIRFIVKLFFEKHSNFSLKARTVPRCSDHCSQFF